MSHILMNLLLCPFIDGIPLVIHTLDHYCQVENDNKAATIRASTQRLSDFDGPF